MIDFHSFGLEKQRISPEIETTVYRIVQEALTNVLKHASVLALFSLGVTQALVTAELDLSFANVASLAAVVTGVASCIRRDQRRVVLPWLRASRTSSNPSTCC